MSRVEVYKINKKDKTLNWVGDAHNAWHGCMHIWVELEQKYLPSLESYPWEDYFGKKEERDYRSRTCMLMDKDKMQEIWDLVSDARLEWNERICMATTLDNFYIAYDDLLEVAEAYENVAFSNENMKKQAEIMRKVYDDGKDGSIIGVWKNENSVCSVYDFCDCDEEDNGILLMPDKWDDVMKWLRQLREQNYEFADSQEDNQD